MAQTPSAKTIAWIALFAGVGLAKYGPSWVGAAAWTLWSTPFVWCALAVAVLYSMARSRAPTDPTVNGVVVRPVEFVDVAPLRVVQPAACGCEAEANREIGRLQAGWDAEKTEAGRLRSMLDETIASLKTIEQRYKIVHRSLRENRERYEGVSSSPSKAEAEIAGIQCEIMKAMEAARR